ncbi:S8 family serine peptidase [Actinocrispum wychmicini]|uniref:Subtilase family protein n=1 Tax=Actinocrispum wychmicini TaxID=1213861 RepID=A0A4R2JHB8_9PSEU|nr:S8 family serine peptidase [Actinocrispum wychmicini]TCO58454.1 subtilase family protein [Actinocrispum wychmicini]
MRKTLIAAVSALPALLLTVVATPAQSATAIEYGVLAAEGVSPDVVARGIQGSGGTVLRRNDAVGLFTVSAPDGFAAKVAKVRGVFSVSLSRPIGQVPTGAKLKSSRDAVEKEGVGSPAGLAAKNRAPKPVGTDPLDDNQWGLKSVRSDLARTKQAGDRRVKVGILDTGVDATNPDIAPNFDRALSRNFTRDIPFDENGNVVDGPCEFRGCVDPSDVDNGGHGTHVAGIIAAAANGFGLSGVAPGVSIVNIRGGQDSGFFFLQPVVDALTYSGDAGLNVVNMSFFVDPWLYNCDNNPADTPEQQAQQRLIKTAITRALNYAHRKGVTLVSAYGNQHTDNGRPVPDTTSPDYPVNTTHTRTIDKATCASLPSDGPHVINVASFGPSQAKADYSTYGLQGISVSAPGGYFRDGLGTPWYRTLDNEILSTYPRNVAETEGLIDAAGNVTPDGVAAGVKTVTTKGGALAVYRPLQGTSMASPHAAGVAALIVSQFGKVKGDRVTMDPDKVERVLAGTAAKIPCPTPRTVDYTVVGRPADWNATCEGTLDFNGFYGHGGVDAWSAVTHGADFLR